MENYKQHGARTKHSPKQPVDEHTSQVWSLPLPTTCYMWKLASFPGRRRDGLVTFASSNCYFCCQEIDSTNQISERSHTTTVNPIASCIEPPQSRKLPGCFSYGLGMRAMRKLAHYTNGYQQMSILYMYSVCEKQAE